MSLTQEKHNVIAAYLSLAAMVLLTILAVANKSISVFYIIYLFWWDEVIKSVFDLFKYSSKKHQLMNSSGFGHSLTGRFFFLFVYIVFIIVFFGFMIDSKNKDMIGLNFEVFMFMNPLFNFSLLSILLREIYLYRHPEESIKTHHLLSSGIITLHISIILGILLWAFITLKLQYLESYAVVLAIIPFMLIKVFFEVQEIKSHQQYGTKM
jgi:hypothetical protein